MAGTIVGSERYNQANWHDAMVLVLFAEQENEPDEANDRHGRR